MIDTTPLTDEQVAALWLSYEETGSYRATGRALGISDTTVARWARKDPIRLAALIAARADARAERFREIEERSIKETLELLEVLTKARTAIAKSGKSGAMSRKEQFQRIPPVLSALQRLAGDAATKVQLLTGGVTERLGSENPGGVDASELTDEQLIGLVGEFDLPIPPGVRDRIARAELERSPEKPKRKPRRRKKAAAKKKPAKK